MPSRDVTATSAALIDVRADELNGDDPMFDSIRADYPGFDEWFTKVRAMRRACLVTVDANGFLGSVVVVKDETDRPYGLGGKVLKVCLYKIAASASGVGLGDALLGRVVARADLAGHDAVYAEMFAKHSATVCKFESFGFADSGFRTDRGELVMIRPARVSL